MYYHYSKACQISGFLSSSQVSLKYNLNYKTETPENCLVNGCTLHPGDQLILHFWHYSKSVPFRNLWVFKNIIFLFAGAK